MQNGCWTGKNPVGEQSDPAYVRRSRPNWTTVLGYLQIRFGDKLFALYQGTTKSRAVKAQKRVGL